MADRIDAAALLQRTRHFATIIAPVNTTPRLREYIELWHALDQEVADNVRLRRGLRIYGDHRPECRLLRAEKLNAVMVANECDCGYEATLDSARIDVARDKPT